MQDIQRLDISFAIYRNTYRGYEVLSTRNVININPLHNSTFKVVVVKEGAGMSITISIILSFMAGGIIGFLLCALLSVNDRRDDE